MCPFKLDHLKLNQPKPKSLEQTVAFSAVDYPMNLETAPMTNQPLAKLQVDFVEPHLANSASTESETSWASHIVTDSTQTPNKNLSLTQKFYNSIALPQFLRFSSFEDSPTSVPKSKQIITISIIAVVLISLIATAYSFLQSSSQTPPVVSSPAQNNRELAQLTSEGMKAASNGNALKQQNKKKEAEIEFNRAEQLFQRAVMLEPSNAKLHVSLASVFIYREKWVEAIAEYREAVRLDPNNAEYKNNLKQLETRKK